ncbi:hypothetical protein IQ279_20570 [Streptomyces verrucosisporus]|uniref:hypothetical protein n=1 Tax=Streptomyces verrucosisporus TaxID=1695161 RepID=UPI0019D2D3E6|nr:hypothetical protein [Streptomyces verrucosisporus]MBN3931992.1 hypothetical protein [Streptomyces verrucosisporus]
MAEALIFAAILGLLVTVMNCVRYADPDHHPVRLYRTWQWALGAALCYCAALLCYGWGAFSGFTKTGEACAVDAGKPPTARPDSISQDAFPLSTVCRWEDGTEVDIVPLFVNPVVLALVAGAVVCLVYAVRTARGHGNAHG